VCVGVWEFACVCECVRLSVCECLETRSRGRLAPRLVSRCVCNCVGVCMCMCVCKRVCECRETLTNARTAVVSGEQAWV